SSSARRVAAYSVSRTQAARCSSAAASAACSRSARPRASSSARANAAPASARSAIRCSSPPIARPSSSSCACSARRAASSPCRRQPPFGPATLLGERLGIGKRSLEATQLGRQRVADLAHPLLGQAQPLVAQHLREECGPLGLPERRHHLQLLLASEVRAEELLM